VFPVFPVLERLRSVDHQGSLCSIVYDAIDISTVTTSEDQDAVKIV